MEHKAREAVSNPASAAGFRSLDLNQPADSEHDSGKRGEELKL